MDAPSVRYATTEDGVRIAYAELGSGTPLLFPVPLMGFRLVVGPLGADPVVDEPRVRDVTEPP